jgi:hypothetical protein
LSFFEGEAKQRNLEVFFFLGGWNGLLHEKRGRWRWRESAVKLARIGVVARFPMCCPTGRSRAKWSELRLGLVFHSGKSIRRAKCREKPDTFAGAEETGFCTFVDSPRT